MTEEEYFRKNCPDYCYGDKPLSPYWDLFEDGVEFGERQSEKKIADLKETNAILSESAAINRKDLEYKVSVIEQRNKKITELEKENRLLGERCNQLLADKGTLTDKLDQAYALLKECAKYVKAIRNYNIYFSTKEGSDKPDALLADVEKFLKGADSDSPKSI